MTASLFGLLLAARWAVAVVPVDPADAELAQNLSGVLEARVAEVTREPIAAGEELKARLGISGRGILGCAADAACLQRVGQALSVERMVVVTVARGVGDEFVLTLKLIDIATGRFVGSEVQQTHGVEQLIDQARTIVTRFCRGEPPPPAAPVGTGALVETPPGEAGGAGTEHPPRRWLPPLVGGLGVAVAATGVILVASVSGDYDHLKQTCAPGCAPSTWSSLQTRANAGYVLVGVGAAVAAGGAIWWLLQPRGASAAPSPRAWVTPAPGGLAVGGIF